MKKLVFLLLALCCINDMSAQSETQAVDKVVDNVTYYWNIPRNYHLKDKIIVINESSYYIGLVSVAVSENGQFKPLGSGSGLESGKDYEIVSYKNNELRKLKNKKIAIKMRGFRSIIDDQESDSKSINPDDLQIRVYESRHDLVIVVFNSLF